MAGTSPGRRASPTTATTPPPFVGGFDEGGTPGLVGPAVGVGADASTFDQLLARSGRDPQWSPA